MPSNLIEKTSKAMIAAFCIVVALSLVLPMIVPYWSFAAFLSAKPFGAMSNESKKLYSSRMKDGELWFPVYELPKNLNSHQGRIRIDRLNLETGVESKTGLDIDIDLWD